jgi:hypothetical protein
MEERETYDPKHSKAYNILRSGGIEDLDKMTEIEVPFEEYQQLQSKIQKNMAISSTVAWTGLSVMDNVGGSFAGSLGNGLAWGFVSGLTRPAPAMLVPRLVFWMPKSMAKTPEEANKKMTEIMVAAYKPMWSQYPYTLKEKKALIGSYVSYRAYYQPSWCEDASSCYGYYKSQPLDFDVEVGRVPSFLGLKNDQEAWVGYTSSKVEFLSPLCMGEMSFQNATNRQKCGEHNRKIMPTFIKGLPSWAFLYRKGVVYQGGGQNAFPFAKVKNEAATK